VKYLFTILLIVNLLNTNAQVNFSPNGGIFDKAITVKLSAENNGNIFYTIDGSTPNSASYRYTKPIVVKDVKVIRAISYFNGKRSAINTQSYFCDRVYSLPVVSITSNPGNFFDYSRGIYVKGCCADSIQPYLGANFWKSWERLCNVEMYDNKGELCFNQQAGMSIFGGWSRGQAQKSLAIIARKRYGKSKFEYPIFEERDNKKYKSFILRNSGGDFLRTQLRDAFMTQMMAPTGIAIQEYEPAIVFINGKYWGIQNLREKINEHYLAQNFGVDKDNVDLLRKRYNIKHGSTKNYKYLLRYMQTKDFSKDETIEELSTFMDIDDFICYNIAEVYSDNRDAGGNIRYFRERTDSAKWRWVLFDLDLGLDHPERNTLEVFTRINNQKWPDPAWSTLIIRKLLTNKKIRDKYIVAYCDYLNTVLSAKEAKTLLENMANAIETEIPYHQKRWGSSVKNWEKQINIIDNFITKRPDYMHQHLKQKFELGQDLQVNIVVPENNTCKIQFNTLKITENFTGKYYQNVPIHITVTPKHDYEFVGWKNRSETSQSLEIRPTANLTLEPILKPKNKSALADSLIINEISCFQIETDSTDDWIELYNTSSSEINLKGFSFSKSKFKNRFTIKNDYLLESKTYVILAKHKQNLMHNYRVDSSQIIGNFMFGLSKNGAHLKLYDNVGLLVDSLTYFLEPKSIDTAVTLSLIHPDSTRSKKSNWILEKPSLLKHSNAYTYYLFEEEQKMIWKKRLYIGGAGFFFISLLGILWFRSSKKKKKQK